MSRIGSVDEIIEAWVRCYDEDELITTSNGSVFRENDILYDWGKHFPMAMRVGIYQLINADRYVLGDRVSTSTAKHQSKVISRCPNPVEIPFSALNRALTGNLSFGEYNFTAEELLDKIEIIDTVSDKWIHSGRFNKKGEEYMIHTLGASLIILDGHYYLSGLDDTASSKSNGYFLTELIGTPSTVSEAFDALKPKEVIDAELAGKEVYRQGEWFFVKEDDIVAPKYIEKKFYLKDNNGEGHHVVSYGFEDGDSQYVKGIVRHTGGEHKLIRLYTDPNCKDWFKAYRNVSKASYGAVGNID